ncbi:MAG TPA: ChbG/HpnK family deacetylase [Bdellovibrionota bacterium]
MNPAELTHKLSPDDWGFAPSINEAAIALAERGLVHTVSVSVRRKFARHKIDELRDLQGEGQVRVALHLDFSFAGCKVRKIHLFTGHALAWREIHEQLWLFREMGLRLDSLNGHRHVHLYPGVLRDLRFAGVPLRLPADASHLGSCLAGLIVRVAKGITWERAGYLRGRDIAHASHLQRKLTKFPQLLCHPAAFDDFDKAEMADPLRGERVTEYNRLLYLFEQSQENPRV